MYVAFLLLRSFRFWVSNPIGWPSKYLPGPAQENRAFSSMLVGSERRVSGTEQGGTSRVRSSWGPRPASVLKEAEQEEALPAAQGLWVYGPQRAAWTPVKVKLLVIQSCPTLFDLMHGSLPSSSVHGILQARILELVAISFSRGSSQPRGRTWVSSIASSFFTIWATRLGPLRVANLLFLEGDRWWLCSPLRCFAQMVSPIWDFHPAWFPLSFWLSQIHFLALGPTDPVHLCHMLCIEFWAGGLLSLYPFPHLKNGGWSDKTPLQADVARGNMLLVSLACGRCDA